MIERIKKRTASVTDDNCAERFAAHSAVEVIGLTVVRNRVPLLNEVSLEVQPGDFVAVMGPNGAGKSTLLRCLAGAVRPDGGAICWFGNSSGRSWAVRRQIGFVGHECALYPELTVLENLTFAGRMNGVARPREQAKKILASADLEQVSARPVRQLSQGVRQRLAIARAVVHEPQLILLDEPFASMDAQGRHWLEQLFDHWRRAGQTVCFASHDVRQSRDLAERIVSLEVGRITAVEPTSCVPVGSRRSA